MLSNKAGQDLTVFGCFRHSNHRERAENPRISGQKMASRCSVGLFRGEKGAYLRGFGVYLRGFWFYLRIGLFGPYTYIYIYFFKKERDRERKGANSLKGGCAVFTFRLNKYARKFRVDYPFSRTFLRILFFNMIKHLIARKAQFGGCAVLHAPMPLKSAQGLTT